MAKLQLQSLTVHESSPSLCTYWYLRRNCQEFHASYFWPDKRPGQRVGAFANIDLGAQTFANASFDAVVTQDVFEHLPDPIAAAKEIHRTLRPDAVHVFTVPRMTHAETRTRARFVSGQWQHLEPPEYHRDPINPGGSLVTTDWGVDLEQRIAEAVGATCEAHCIHEPDCGIPAPIEVFVAQNPPSTIYP